MPAPTTKEWDGFNTENKIMSIDQVPDQKSPFESEIVIQARIQRVFHLIQFFILQWLCYHIFHEPRFKLLLDFFPTGCQWTQKSRKCRVPGPLAVSVNQLPAQVQSQRTKIFNHSFLHRAV